MRHTGIPAFQDAMVIAHELGATARPTRVSSLATVFGSSYVGTHLLVSTPSTMALSTRSLPEEQASFDATSTLRCMTLFADTQASCDRGLSLLGRCKHTRPCAACTSRWL